jgi:predicted dehydrogenase
LNPQKVRTITLVGTQRMVVWNDMEPLEQIRVYDKGVMEEPYYDSFGEFQLRLREGDVVIPRLQLQEPLKTQADAFLRRVRTGEPTPSESDAGLRVAAALEAIARSLAEDGRRVPVAEVSKA